MHRPNDTDITNAILDHTNTRSGFVEVMIDKTKQELGIDFLALDNAANDNVYVCCTNCHEEFKRERRNLHKLHHCPAQATTGSGIIMNWCYTCRHYKPISSFSSSTGNCCNYCDSSIKTWTERELTKTNGQCSAQQLVDVYNQQHGRCFYLQLPLDLKRQGYYKSATIEKLDRRHKWAVNNVIIVCELAKELKSNVPDHFGLAQPGRNDVDEHQHTDQVRIEVKIISPDGCLPKRKLITDAGYDIAGITDVTIKPHKTADISTGIIAVIPPGFYATLDSRSSSWPKNLLPMRSIIDATYQGELIVKVLNFGDDPYHIQKGDRIGQLIIHRLIHADFTVIEKFSTHYSGRNTNGYGSSGR